MREGLEDWHPPGKVEEFTAALNAIRPLLREQSGFCGLLALRSGTGALETTVVSLWTSIDDLRNSREPYFNRRPQAFFPIANLIPSCAK